MSNRPSSELFKTIRFLLVAAAVLGLCVWGAWQHPTGRDVIRHVVGFFGIVFTPFVLETTLFLTGALVLFAWLHHVRKKEGDGWVYLAEVHPDPSPGAPTGADSRHTSAVFLERPEAIDTEKLDEAAVEGYLDLGLEEDAALILARHPPTDRHPAWQSLAFRLLLQQEKWNEAMDLQENLLSRHVEAAELLRPAAREAASVWRKRGREDAALTCEKWP